MSETSAPRRFVLALARASALLWLLAPAAALACPACIQSDVKARTAIPVVMSFLIVPFLIFGGAALLIVRRTRRAAAVRAAAVPSAVGPGRLVYLAESSQADDAAGLRRPAA